MGTVKKEIALLGDTLNTTARIVDACRESGELVIASSALLRQLTIPAGIDARPLGPIQLRGKKSLVQLFALNPAANGVTTDRLYLKGLGRALTEGHSVRNDSARSKTSRPPRRSRP